MIPSAEAQAFAWAREMGILDGTDYDPDAAVTRGEAVTLLWRASGSPAPSDMETPFSESAREPYRSAIIWASEKGIARGTGDRGFDPDAPVTRTQMAAFLYRAAGEPG
ncbi:MAG: S-layer homology domain-containing protein [Ruminococcaceae bacterium]|nr:S-layer homology domain-containing protein [Oscillospiraceae bacterium]